MILLIDGHSGSGKTTFAGHLQGVLGWPVIHLEDVYPGWHGLAAASKLVATSIINPAIPAQQRGFQRWDWYAGDFAEWVATPAGGSLIIEGCGALTAANLGAAKAIGDGQVWGVWVDLDTRTRYRRAMERDANFEPHWNLWAEQEDEFYGAHHPQSLAHWRVDASRLPARCH